MEEKFLHEEDPEAERNLRFLTKSALNKEASDKICTDFDISQISKKNSFSREEKLKSKKIIEQLFKEGKSVSSNGFTLVYLELPLNTFYPAQAGVSVSKKFFKQAVARNRIKRLIREAYRLNKLSFYKKLTERKQQMALMFIYNGKGTPEYATVEKAVVVCLNKCGKT